MEKTNAHISRALELIDKKYYDNLTLDYMANHLYLNKCYFCTIFKQCMGKSFCNYLNEVRIEKSKELLKNEELSMLEIAHAVGFNNQTYYNSLFKKLTNLTPMQYKKCNCSYA